MPLRRSAVPCGRGDSVSEDRAPVIIGVGQFAEAPHQPNYRALSPVELAAAAEPPQIGRHDRLDGIGFDSEIREGERVRRNDAVVPEQSHLVAGQKRIGQQLQHMGLEHRQREG